jgi:hypothetical protein
MFSTPQERVRTLLRFGAYAACAILSAVNVKTTAFGLAMILPGSVAIAYIVAVVLQIIIVSASWLFFGRLTGRIDANTSFIRSAGLLATCFALWFIGAFFSVTGSYLAYDHRLADHRARSLTEEHRTAAMLFGSRVAGQLAERESFARARLERLTRLRDDEIEGRISGKSGCDQLCRGLTDRVLELDGHAARLARLSTELGGCPIEDVRCAQNILDRTAATDPILQRLLIETREFLRPWRGDLLLPDDWERTTFSAAPSIPALRAEPPSRLAGFHDLKMRRTESLYALAAALAIELLLVVIACLGVLLVPVTPPVAPKPKIEKPVAEPKPARSKRRPPTRSEYTTAQKNRLIRSAQKLRKESRSFREISETLHLSRSTLTRWLNAKPKANVLALEIEEETETDPAVGGAV